MVLVDVEAHVGALVAGQQHDLVATGILVLLVQREVLERRVDECHVGFARYDLQVVGLPIDDVGHDPVDVGELLALGIHLPVIRVALVHLVGRVGLGQHPRLHGGKVHVLAGIPPEMVAERLHPGVEALLLGKRVRIRVVPDVPLLQVVLGIVGVPVTAGRLRHLQGQDRVGHIGLQPYGVVVDLDRPARLRQPHPGLDLFVPVHVLVHEDDVVGRERRPIGPLRPLPQEDGDALVVRGLLEALGEVSLDLQAVEAEAAQVAAALGLFLQVAPRRIVGGVHVQRAAVPTHRLDRLQQRRLDGQPLIHRRQFAAGHQLGQHRRLPVLAGRDRHLLRPGVGCFLGAARQRTNGRDQKDSCNEQDCLRHSVPPPGRPPRSWTRH